MKNLKLIPLVMIIITQSSLITAFSETPEERLKRKIKEDRFFEHNKFLQQKEAKLNKEYQKLIEEEGFPTVLAQIIMDYANPEYEIRVNNNLYDSMLHNDISGMKNAIENGANVNLTIKLTGDTPLILTIKILSKGIYDPGVGIKSFIKYLIDNGADINAQDIDGNTALMLAIQTIYSKDIITRKVYLHLIPELIAINNNVVSLMQELVNLLLKNKVNLNIQNKHGQTALMFAVTSGDDELVRKLINHGADKNIMDVNGKKAYNYTENSEIQEILYSKELRRQEEKLEKEKELEKSKELEKKRNKEQEQSKYDEIVGAVTSKEIQQQFLQRREELQRQQDEQRLAAQRAKEALARVANEEDVWAEEPEAEEGWGEMEQED